MAKKQNTGIGGFLAECVSDAVTDVARELIRETTKSAVKQGVRIGLRQARQGISGLSMVPSYAGADWPKWFTKSLTNRAGGVYPVIGRRHSGKSTFCVAMAEYIQGQTNCPIYFPGYPKNKAPHHIIPVAEAKMQEVMANAPPGAVLILDDASRWGSMSSRRYMSDEAIDFENWINKMAHMGIHCFINVQDSSGLHKAGLRADVLCIKPPERMFEGSERKAMRPLIKQAVAEFARLPKSQWVSHIWIRGPDGDEQSTMIKYERPPWMTTEMAKYRGRAFSSGGGSQQGNERRVSGAYSTPGYPGGIVDTSDYRVLDSGNRDPLDPFSDDFILV